MMRVGKSTILRYEGKIEPEPLDQWSNVRNDLGILWYESGRTQRTYPNKGLLGEFMSLRKGPNDESITEFARHYGILGIDVTLARRPACKADNWTPNDGFIYAEPIANYRDYAALIHALHSIEVVFRPDNITKPRLAEHWTTIAHLVLVKKVAGGERLLHERTGSIIPGLSVDGSIQCKNGEALFEYFINEDVPRWTHPWLVAVILGGMVEFDTFIDSVIGWSAPENEADEKEEETRISLRTRPRLSVALDHRFGYADGDGLIHLAYSSVLAAAVAELVARMGAGTSTCVICGAPTPSRRSRTCCSKHARELANSRKMRSWNKNKDRWRKSGGNDADTSSTP